MKRIFGFAVAALLLAGCSDDDKSDPAVNLDHLQKRWYPVSYKLGNQTTTYPGHMPCGKDYIEFQAGNNVKDVDYYDCQEDADIMLGTYTATDETLSYTIEGVTESFTLKKLNSKRLETQATLNGATITYIYTSTP
ncbi:membrane lipoprotein lipid attachment site-containing protein [uncultured Flavobacterium sp.]|uniref:membrane lipoprotein lipid attachment site-containing protein n=1 Tax=uncultured Flavobacterium sp. TaxID=165435 RepID=UPI0026001161|nr:membrane lipoprotein lipid attachment site-containing protein [uncultured Flavobacterium sp.]